MHKTFATTGSRLLRRGKNAVLSGWTGPALSTGIALCLLATSLNAQAVALGAVTVQSALGQPLRAEITIPQISSEEAASFEAHLGLPAAFKSAGVEYNAALVGTSIDVQRRPNGETYLRIMGQKPVNEPVLSLLIEASWASGQVVRDYTLLLDPLPRSEEQATTEAQPQVTQDAARAPAAAATATVGEQVAARPPARAPRERPATRRGTPAASTPAKDGRVRVRWGDTASRLAVRNGLRGVSLDQMLVAMLRANPDAFINDNVNLIRAGAVIQMPSAEQARATSRDDARRLVIAQTEDFIAYRRGLASNVRTTRTAASGRSAEGQVQATVVDQQRPATPEDKLVISKGAADTAGAGSAAGVAATREKEDENERITKLSKNVDELQEGLDKLAKLEDNSAGTPAPSTQEGGTPATAVTAPAADQSATPSDTGTPGQPAADGAAAGPTTAGTATGAGAASDAEPGAATPADQAGSTGGQQAADSAASAPPVTTVTPGAQPGSAAPSPTEPAPVQKPAPVSAPAASPPARSQPDWFDLLMEYRLYIVAALAALVLLALLGRMRGRKRTKGSDGPFGETGDSGGVTISAMSTGQPLTTGSDSSPSSGGPTTSTSDDLVEKALGYLEFGRDEKAEQLLTKALRDQPDRHEIYQYLAHVYADRNDATSLEKIARQAQEKVSPESTYWKAIAALGAKIDPGNSLYRGGAGTHTERKAVDSPAVFDGDAFWADSQVGKDIPEPGEGNLGAESQPLDLDLDFEEGDFSTSAVPLNTRPTGLATAAFIGNGRSTDDEDDGGVDLEIDTQESPLPAEDNSMDFRLKFSDPLQPTQVQEHETEALQPPTTAPGSAMVEFNLDDLVPSGTGTPAVDDATEDGDGDPLATTLALAQQFQSIGDIEGARSLAEEVLRGATGALRAKAEQLLADLG